MESKDIFQIKIASDIKNIYLCHFSENVSFYAAGMSPPLL